MSSVLLDLNVADDVLSSVAIFACASKKGKIAWSGLVERRDTRDGGLTGLPLEAS